MWEPLFFMKKEETCKNRPQGEQVKDNQGESNP